MRWLLPVVICLLFFGALFVVALAMAVVLPTSAAWVVAIGLFVGGWAGLGWNIRRFRCPGKLIQGECKRRAEEQPILIEDWPVRKQAEVEARK